MSNSFVTPWTVAHQAHLSNGFLRQEYWSGLLFPSPGDLPDPGIKPVSPALSDGFFTTELPGKPNSMFLSSLFVSLRCFMDSPGLAWLLLNSWKGYFMSSGLMNAVNKPYIAVTQFWVFRIGSREGSERWKREWKESRLGHWEWWMF